MRVLFFILFTYSALFSSQIKDKDYLGSSYNLFLVMEQSCLSFAINTDTINEHIGFSTNYSFCDQYLDDSQEYLEWTYSIGTGVMLFSNSIYRDSFFTSLSFDLNKKFLTNILNNTSGDSTSISTKVAVGYQWHFKRGYILSLSAYFLYDDVLNYDDTPNLELNNKLSKNTTKRTPSILLGWRF